MNGRNIPNFEKERDISVKKADSNLARHDQSSSQHIVVKLSTVKCKYSKMCPREMPHYLHGSPVRLIAGFSSETTNQESGV